MIYYQVKKDAPRFVRDKTGRLKAEGDFVPDELYTEQELARFVNGRAVCAPVEISKNEIYWLFGCRFKIKGEAFR